MLAFLFVYTFLFSILAFKRFEWAVLLTIFLLPSYLIRFDVFGLPLTLLEVMILIIFSVWIIKSGRQLFLNIKNNLRGRREAVRYPFDWEIVFLLIVSLVAVGVAGLSNDAFGIWKAYFFEPILLFLVILNTFKGFSGLRKILWSLAASVFFISILAVYQKITGNFISNPSWAQEETRRVVSFFGYPNAVGLFLAPLVMVFVGWLAQEIKNKISVLNYELKIGSVIAVATVALLAVVSIFFAKSEGALIGMAAGLFVFLLLHKKLKWVALALLIAGSSILYFNQPIRGYAISKATLSDFSGQIRKLQWTETWKMLQDGKIISGAGLANYKKAVAPYHQEGFFFNRDNDPEFHEKTVFDAEYRKKYWQPLEIYLYPHNIFLNFWVELGLGGLVLFIWIIGKFFSTGVVLIRNKFSNYGFMIAGLVAAMIVIVVHGLVDAPYFKNDLSVMFWILIAMMGMIRSEAVTEI